MFVNVWSTPRTGSIWYTFWTRDYYAQTFSKDKVSVLTEMFNPHHLGIYHKVTDTGLQNSHEWSPGFYYEEYDLVDGSIVKTRVQSPRSRSVVEEADYRLGLVEGCEGAGGGITIVHNHVTPLVPGAYDILMRKAVRNVYLYRKDIEAQLASYGVAYATRTFSKFSPGLEVTHRGLHPDPGPLKELAERIIFWHKLPKSDTSQVIAYEDMPVIERFGLPYKQNKMSAMDKLDASTQELIRSLVQHVRKEI